MDRFLNAMIDTKKDVYLADVKIKFGYDLVKNEFMKFVIFTLFFLVTGKLSLYLFALALFIPIRIFSGGMHMKSNRACGLVSFVFLILAIYILPLIPATFNVSILIMSLSFMTLALLSPFSSPKKPIASKEKYYRFKIISIVFSIAAYIIIIGCFYYGAYIYASTGMWILSLQALQLAAAHILKRKEEHKHDKTT